jgi:hypothetical protein
MLDLAEGVGMSSRLAFWVATACLFASLGITSGVAAEAAADVKTLEEGKSADAVRDTAVALLRSGDPDQQRLVVGMLGRDDFLKRLDPPDDEWRPARRRRIWPVLTAVATLAPDRANPLLVWLSDNATFTISSERVGFLQNACGEVRHPSPELLQYFRKTPRCATPASGSAPSSNAARRRPDPVREVGGHPVVPITHEGWARWLRDKLDRERRARTLSPAPPHTVCVASGPNCSR